MTARRTSDADADVDVDVEAAASSDADRPDAQTDDPRAEADAGDADRSADDATEAVGEVALDGGRRAELEEERNFLLTSLTDLQREFAAGDLDRHDYQVLRDGYTGRAAAVLRELERGSEPVGPKRRIPWRKVVAVAGAATALFGVVWWALSASSAQRLPDQSITGFDPRSDRQKLLAQAYQLQMQQPAEATVLYSMVLEEYPDDVEALTYGGWTRALAVVRTDSDSDTKVSELTTAAGMLSKAIELDPDYPDPLCLRGVLYGRFLERPDLATPDLDRCLELNPPAEMREMISGLRDNLNPSVAPTTPAP